MILDAAAKRTSERHVAHRRTRPSMSNAKATAAACRQKIYATSSEAIADARRKEIREETSAVLDIAQTPARSQRKARRPKGEDHAEEHRRPRKGLHTRVRVSVDAGNEEKQLFRCRLLLLAQRERAAHTLVRGYLELIQTQATHQTGQKSQPARKTSSGALLSREAIARCFLLGFR